MLCVVVIPGQTGCLAIREVPAPRRSKKVETLNRIAAQKKAAVAEVDEPHFHGGTLEKKSKNTMTYRRYKRNVRAHNARQHTRRRSFRESFRLYLRLAIR